jgi:hypothetical protein
MPTGCASTLSPARSLKLGKDRSTAEEVEVKCPAGLISLALLEIFDITTDKISSPAPVSTQSCPPSKSVGFDYDLAHHHLTCSVLGVCSVVQAGPVSAGP